MKLYHIFALVATCACVWVPVPLKGQLRTLAQGATPQEKVSRVKPIKVNRLPAGTDSVYALPYMENFDDKAAFEQFTVVNSNNDDCTWIYDTRLQAARYSNSATLPADDWLMTPALKLDKAHAYTLKFKYRAGFWNYTEAFEVGVGAGTDIALFKNIVPRIETAVDSYQWNETEFNVDEDGNYRIGVHAVSKVDQYYLFIDEISVVEKAVLAAPAAATSIDVTPGAQGALTAQVAFKAPELAYDGTPLESLTKVELYRGERLLTTFSNPAPGEQLSYTDSSPAQGTNHYAVVGYNAAGKGQVAVKSAYVGIDIPAAPQHIMLGEAAQGVSLSWQAPAEGVHHGYYDASTLKYNIYSQEGEIIVKNTGQTTYTDDKVVLTGPQSLLYYGVSALTSGGESPIAPSNALVVGDAYTLPFHESFALGEPLPEHFFWAEQSGENGYVFSKTHSYDDEYGCLEFLPKNEGDKASFNTGKIDISSAENPAVMFTFFGYPGHPIKLKVVATSPQRTDTLATFDYTKIGDVKEWKKNVLLLDKFKTDDYVVLKFLAESNDLAIPVYIDDINVIDYFEYNVKAELRIFAEGKVGQESMIGVKLTNMGSQPTTDMTVALYVEGEKVDEHECFDLPVNLNSMEFLYYAPKLTDPDTIHVYAVVSYAKDQDLNDNTTFVGKMNIRHPIYPRVGDLAGNVTGKGNVHLWWTAPTGIEGGEKTESFESYEPWIIDNIGFWTVVDADRGSTYGISAVEFKHETEPMAFMTFNPKALGIDVESVPQFKPATGDQYLVAMSAISSTAQSGHNDDWLISPLLTGEAQTVSFLAKNLDISYPEKFEVLYSTTDKDISNFIVLKTVEDPLSEWTQIQTDLPQGALYFAIRSIATDSYALMIDDIDYQAAPLNIIGYNVYMDKEKVGRTGGATTFDKSDIALGVHDFRVSTLYSVGESALSNVVSLDVSTSGVEQPTAAPASVTVGERVISMKAPTGTCAFIYTVDGRVFYSGCLTSPSLDVTVPSGVYIVRLGDQLIKKVIVN